MHHIFEQLTIINNFNWKVLLFHLQIKLFHNACIFKLVAPSISMQTSEMYEMPQILAFQKAAKKEAES